MATTTADGDTTFPDRTPMTPPPTETKQKRFSMMRSFSLADFVTIGNGFAGTGTILSLMQYLVSSDRTFLWIGFGLLPIAFVLDALDGAIARWRFKSSPLGADLDSLADVISFGVAPAALAFAVGLRGSLDVLILLYFVACGISRLARFNVTAAALADERGKVKYFEGTPIPTSLLLVAVLAVCTWLGRIHGDMLFGVWEAGPLVLHPISILYLLSGSAMISKTLRIPKP